MARPKNPDRDAVADETLTVRFTKPEIARLKVLVAQREAELRSTGARINAGGLVRALVVAELDKLGIVAPTSASEAASVQPILPGLGAAAVSSAVSLPVGPPVPGPPQTTAATPASPPAAPPSSLSTPATSTPALARTSAKKTPKKPAKTPPGARARAAKKTTASKKPRRKKTRR